MSTHKLAALGRFGVIFTILLASAEYAVAGGHGGGGGGHGGGGHSGGHGGSFNGHGFNGHGFHSAGWGWGGGWGWGPGWGWDGGWGWGWDSPVFVVPVGFPSVVILADANSSATPANDATCHLTVTVPTPDAVVLLNGARTEQSDTVRRFQTPALLAGKNYSYEVQVRWTENGHAREQARTVTVQAGSRVAVDLTAPADVARLSVALPKPDAEVWLNGSKTSLAGANRRFKSPTLVPGQKYEYEVRATWTEDGQQRESTKTVVVEAGSQISVDLAPANLTARK